jgi:alkylation response protein AidB-like acyl-CoA dehydrogenase
MIGLDEEREVTERIIARVHEAGPVLREFAAQADRERRLPQASIDALESTGVFRINSPKAHGGFEGGARMLLDVTSTIGTYCTNAAWISVISSVSTMLALRFPQSVQRRVFAKGRSSRMSSIIVSPRGSAVRERDGYRVSGEWPFASNVFHAEWSIGIVPITESPGAEPEMGYALLHKEQYSVKDTWFSVGMRGTGSNTIVATEQRVPADQIVRMGELLGPRFETAPDASFLQRLSPVSMFPTVIISGPLGAAKAALALTAEQAAKRPVTYSKYQQQNASGAFVQGIGAVRAKIDTAELMLQRAADTIDAAARKHVSMSPATRAGIRNDVGHATHNLADALNDIAWLHGTVTFAEFNPLSRLWRDVHTGVRHAIAASPLGYEIGGAAVLGVEAPTPLV